MDWPLSVGGATLSGIGFYLGTQVKPLAYSEIEALRPGQIPAFDRFATRFWSRGAATASDVGVYSLMASPLFFLSDSAARNEGSAIPVMAWEAYSLTYGINNIIKNTVLRNRPYTYNPNAPKSLQISKDARRSFYSGHTAFSFMSAIFFAKVYTDLHPGAKENPYVWGGAVILASTVGLLRILAGRHFLSDVLAGAIAGTLAGYAVPEIHRTSDSSAPGQGVSISQVQLRRSF